jgi:hypothetical protein
VGNVGNEYVNLVIHTEKNRSLEKLKFGREDNIKIDLKYIEYAGGDWNQMPQNTD